MISTKVKIYTLFLVLIIFSSLNQEAFAIKITKSDYMTDVIIDGKWTFGSEWKPSSKDYIETDPKIILRSAHQDNFIYFLINAVDDETIDNKKDNATICLEPRGDIDEEFKEEIFCFSILLGEKQPITKKYNSEKGEFEIVENHPELNIISANQDAFDLFSEIPHASYEFKIPTDLVHRTFEYGLFVKVYDKSADRIYSMPSGVVQEIEDIPSPEQWEIMFSPDKTLPEFNMPMMIVLISLIASAFLVKLKPNLFRARYA